MNEIRTECLTRREVAERLARLRIAQDIESLGGAIVPHARRHRLSGFISRHVKAKENRNG